MKTSAVFLLLCVIILGTFGIYNADADQLKKDYYKKSCPQIEMIVRNITWSKVAANSKLAAKLIRIHYHDCFVRGCDASLLLDSTSNNTAEKAALQNRGVSGYEIIDEIKLKLEEECHDIVSCADIVALAARDAVSFQFQRPIWDVPTGRKDGRVSIASEVSQNLPSASANFTTLLQNFKNHGLDIDDLVTLSGAHTLGETHCTLIARRLYNFTGKGDTDPSLDPDYAETLKTTCPIPINPATTLEMDPGSTTSFDSHYFVALNQGKTLFLSDSALLTDPHAADIAKDFEDFDHFLEHFKESIKKMGAIGILTDKNGGEIRKNCRVTNP